MRTLGLILALLGVAHLAAEERIETIKVLVVEEAAAPVVEVTGGYRVYDPADQRTISGGLRGKRFPIKSMNTGIKWGEQYPAVYQITVEPRRAESVIVIDGVQYGGKVHVYQIGGKISIVNEIPVDDYLRITLAKEFETARSPEVMAAVAIAARTHAYFQAEKGHRSYWHVRGEEVGYEGLASPRQAAVDQAVNETTNMVMLKGDHAFPAVWTGNCGGKTCAYQLMFRQPNGGALQGVVAPYALKAREQTAWRVAVPKEWLARAARLDDITTMNLYADPESKKVYGIRFSDGQRAQDVSFFKLQKAIGAERLRSSDFTAEVVDDQVVFSGYGEGHGVGLCLYSAAEMARGGKNAAQILTTFYPDAQIRIAGAAPIGGLPATQLSAAGRYNQRGVWR